MGVILQRLYEKFTNTVKHMYEKMTACLGLWILFYSNSNYSKNHAYLLQTKRDTMTNNDLHDRLQALGATYQLSFQRFSLFYF